MDTNYFIFRDSPLTADWRPAQRRSPLSTFHDLHPVEKPRERLARNGPAALKDEELLAILLRTGYRDMDVLALARDLLKRHPGRGLYELPFRELKNLKGVGFSRAATLKAAWELAGRHAEPIDKRPAITSPQNVCAQVSDLRAQKKEHFVALYLNTRNQLLHRETVSVGTLNATLVHPREVFEPALRHSAASVVLVHNHPSGDPSPSEEDRRLTKQLTEAGRILGIDVLDHIVIAQALHYSFQENRDL